MTRVLIVEDNHDLAFGLRNNLEIEGYIVDVAADGPSGLSSVRQARPDLVVLDLMLPGLDGYRVLRQLRHYGLTMPVLILTAKGEEADKVQGFRLGGDDYVTNPFGVLELLARIEALLRRSRPAATTAAQPIQRIGDVQVDVSTRTVRRETTEVPLTPMEFDLLVALMRRNGAVVSRIELLSEIWGHSSAVLTRTVDTHTGELRRKLERDPSRPRHILTVRKAGYRLAL